MIVNTTSFSELDLLPQIHQALQAAGYTTPTPIQAQAIPHLLDGRDVLGTAQTGTGKTAAFALPILHALGRENQRAQPRAPRALILSPTRELAAQIGESFQAYGRFLKLRHAVVFGGVGQGQQVRILNRGVHLLVATPGRLLDLMGQGCISLENLEIFVLDEADRMLDMGFLPDLKRIISRLPDQRQSLFFSATLPPKVGELAHSLLRDPVRVEVAPQSTTVDQIEQHVLHVPQTHKADLLSQIVQAPEVGKVVVFTRTKRGADRVTRHLYQGGVRAEAIHGNKSQGARTRTLDKFRNDRLRVLVATDLAARGIDVDGITHVINFDLPHEPEAYVHRIGRTGRAGASGVAFTFCDPSERGLLRAIEKLIRRSIAVHADHPDRQPAAGQSERRAPAPSRNRKGPPRARRRKPKPGKPSPARRVPAGRSS